MRLISDGVVDREGIGGLAARLGYTPRHVHRLLVSELGAGPLALARARRAQSARALLTGSALPVTQVAFAAGFGSIRQFNDTVREVFDVAPHELRARSRGAGATASLRPPESPGTGVGPVRLELDLPVRCPFDAPGVLAFLAARAVPGVETCDLSEPDRLRYARTLDLPQGPGAVEITAVRSKAGDWSARVRLELAALSDAAPAVARVRRLLDLDADPTAVDRALSADPDLAALVAAIPGIRVPGAVDPHELVIRAIVGQQISVSAARGHLARLAASAGFPCTSAFPGLTRLFPAPGRIVAAVPEPEADGPLDPERPLRLPRRAIRTVRSIAGALDAGELQVHVGADPEALRARLIAQPGIGDWTAAYVALRVLGDPDAWLTGDVALVAGALKAGVLAAGSPKPEAHRLLAARAEKWAPWRSYAAMHLWRAATRPLTNGALS